MPPGPLSILVIDNDDNVHRSLRTLTLTHAELVGQVATVHTVDEIEAAPEHVDAIVLDFWLGRDAHSSMASMERITEWRLPVILYTSEERPQMINAAVAQGISALCLKHDGIEAMVDALRRLRDDEPGLSRHLAAAIDRLPPLQARLTPTEARVLRGLAYGLEAPDIATHLVVDVESVRSHIKHIHEKYKDALGVDRITRQQAVRAALEDGYWDSREWHDPWNITR